MFRRLATALAVFSLAMAPALLSLGNQEVAYSVQLEPGCAVTETQEILCTRTFTYAANSSGATWTIPAQVTKVLLEQWGGAGGSGGLDCGTGCTAHGGSEVGHLSYQLTVTPGDTIAVYPGQGGGNGASTASGSGGGSAGRSSYSSSYNGGRGGNAGSVGTSGAGGGGGAATVVSYGQSFFIAAGAGGGGGAGNYSASGRDGSGENIPAATSVGDNGGVPDCVDICDGGGGGGGGGGATGGAGGNVYVLPSQREVAGLGGTVGSNFVAALATRVINNVVSPSNASKVQISYFASPVATISSTKTVSTDPNMNFSVEFSTKIDDASFTADDLSVTGSASPSINWDISITTRPTHGPWTYDVRVIPKSGIEPSDGTVVLNVDTSRIFGFEGTRGSADAAAGTIVLERYLPTVKITPDSSSTGTDATFNLVFSEPVTDVYATGFNAAVGCQILEVTGSGTDYRVSLSCIEGSSPSVSLIGSTAKDFAGNFVPASQSSALDFTPPTGNFVLNQQAKDSTSHVFSVIFSEPIKGLTVGDFILLAGTAKNCKVASVTGTLETYTVKISGCTGGTFGLTLKSDSVTDRARNAGPTSPITSGIQNLAVPDPVANVIAGTIPASIIDTPLTTYFGSLRSETVSALDTANIIGAPSGLPALRVIADLSTISPIDQVALTSSKSLVAGTGLSVDLVPPSGTNANLDVMAFIQIDGQWQYLGRTSISNGDIQTPEIAFLNSGSYALKLSLVDHNFASTIGYSKSLNNGQFNTVTAALVKAGVDPSLTNSNQTISIVVTVTPNPNVVITIPQPVPTPTPTPSPEITGGYLGVSLPTFTPGAPVANPGIGATGDDNAPSKPFNPMASPEGIKAVATTTTAVVAVAASVAAAGAAAAGAGAAAGASAGAGSSAGAGRGGTSQPNSANNSSSDPGSLANIDASIDTFEAMHQHAGDRARIFRPRWMRFFDRKTHNATVFFARLSPILAKALNDGAYLRAIFGIFWTLSPAAGISLAVMALLDSNHDGLVPAWTWLLLISVLGVFDALAGLLASLTLGIGLISIYGIHSANDIRLLLGVMALCFGPVIISLGFRAVRRQGIVSLSLFWERVVDFAVLTFFSGWTAATMISTLPALAGRTLVVANHLSDIAVAIASAIAARIVLEEVACKWFPARLNVISPTEVPDPNLFQRSAALCLRVGLFVFVTAAIVGSSWQVWVGAILFAIPTLLGWFSDKFPNSRRLWVILPSGVPGLAFTLLIASVSSAFIGTVLGNTPDRAQWSFALLPIPMVLLSLISLFGRHGRNAEEKPLKRDKFRFIYRFGGPVVLLVTMKLAGFI